jgi:hypothetical protein
MGMSDFHKTLVDIINERLQVEEKQEPAEFFASRKEIASRFASATPPHRRDPLWKYVPFEKLFSPAEKRKAELHLLQNIPGTLYGKAISLLNHEEEREFLEKYLTRNQHITSYTAMLAAAVPCPRLLSISEDAKVDIIFHNAYDRFLVLVKKGVTARINEVSVVDRFATCIIEYVVEEDATLEVISREVKDDTRRVFSRFITLAKDARFVHVTNYEKGAYLRDEISVMINGKNADVKLLGSENIKNGSMIDTRMLIIHAEGGSKSLAMYRSVLDDTATHIFGGKIIIEKGADKTEADMTNKAILLTDNARMFGEPQLEIFTDDVKCTHGTSTGSVNEEALFYLQSRGVSKSEAQRELLESFLSEPLALVK